MEKPTEESLLVRERPRLVILISNGILEDLITDEALNLEILKVDVDEESEYPLIYRIHEIEVNPEVVEDNFQNARSFWRQTRQCH